MRLAVGKAPARVIPNGANPFVPLGMTNEHSRLMRITEVDMSRHNTR
jgi:hypothetical protein